MVKQVPVISKNRSDIENESQKIFIFIFILVWSWRLSSWVVNSTVNQYDLILFI